MSRIPRKLKKKISRGHYCYEPDNKKNEEEKSLKTYWIKPCGFYNHVYGLDGHCSLLKTDVMDQVKECNTRI
jgi:hypothetical protein